MVILILNDEFRTVDVLRKYTYATYEKKFRDIGTFEIHAQLCQENLYLLTRDKFFVLFFEEGTTDEPYVFGEVQNISRDEDSDFSAQISIKGELALTLLKKRVIKGTLSIIGATHEFIKILIEREFIKTDEPERRVDINVVYQDEEKLDKTCSVFESQFTGGYMWDEIKERLDYDKIGLDLYPIVDVYDNGEINIKSWELLIMAGIDRTQTNSDGNEPVILSKSLSNINRTEYEYDTADYKNVAYVAGEGEGSERKWFEEFPNEVEAASNRSGWNRNELWIDARDIQSEAEDSNSTETKQLTDEEYHELIIQRAKEKFEENLISEVYSSTLLTKSSMYEYGKNLFLGDWTTNIDSELGITVDAQITQATVTFDEKRKIVDLSCEYGSIEHKIKRRLNRQKEEQDVLRKRVEYLEQLLKTGKTDSSEGGEEVLTKRAIIEALGYTPVKDDHDTITRIKINGEGDYRTGDIDITIPPDLSDRVGTLEANDVVQDRAIANANTQIDQFKQDFQRLATENVARDSKISDLEKAEKALETNVNGQAETINGIQETIQTHAQEYEDLEGRVSTAEGSITQYGTDIENLKTADETLQGNIDKVAENVTKVSESVTKVSEQVGAVTADSIGAVSDADVGKAGGVAGLDGTGRVPAAQLPSYVDDVVEYDAKASFPSPGETGKLYVDLSDNSLYRWSGTQYIPMMERVLISDDTVTFTTAATRTNIASGEKMSTIFGKIAKYFADLKTVAFTNSYSDLDNKPAIPTIPGSLKNPNPLVFTGGSTVSYDGSSRQTVALTAATVGLGNVNNTADSAKTVLAANKLSGFSSGIAGGTITWGNQTGTAIHQMTDSGGGAIGWRMNNPASGKMSQVIDGLYYQDEGLQRCLDVRNYAKTAAITMTAAGWNKSAKTYSFEGSYPVGTYDIEIQPNSTCTDAQIAAWSAAQIVGSATTNVAKAYGIVPTVDIPIIIRYSNKV